VAEQPVSIKTTGHTQIQFRIFMFAILSKHDFPSISQTFKAARLLFLNVWIPAPRLWGDMPGGKDKGLC
jgi:hypothetical protein